MNVQVAEGHYKNPGYLTVERFASVAVQLDLIRECAPQTVLECGVGSGLLRLMVREFGAGIRYSCVDIDKTLAPDHVASVKQLPFEVGYFDATCCFEVLEHIPFNEVGGAVRELCRVARHHVIVSVPDVTPYFGVQLMHPLASRLAMPSGERIFSLFRNPRRCFHRVVRKGLVNLPSFRLKHIFRGEHYWEIGKREVCVQDLLRIFAASRLCVVKRFRSWHCPYHHFFVLRKEVVQP